MKILLLLTLILLSVTLSAQRTRTAEDYAAKSRKLRTGAWIFAGSGIAMVATGIIIFDKNNWNLDSEVALFNGSLGLMVVGIACITASIPLFIVSAHNKR